MLATTPRLYASTHEACASSTGQRIVVAASSAAVISARLAGHPAWHKDAASHSPATLGRAGDIRFPMMHASMWFSQDGIPADQTILTLRVWRRPCDLSICTISRQVHARAHSHAPACPPRHTAEQPLQPRALVSPSLPVTSHSSPLAVNVGATRCIRSLISQRPRAQHCTTSKRHYLASEASKQKLTGRARYQLSAQTPPWTCLPGRPTSPRPLRRHSARATRTGKTGYAGILLLIRLHPKMTSLLPAQARMILPSRILPSQL